MSGKVLPQLGSPMAAGLTPDLRVPRMATAPLLARKTGAKDNGPCLPEPLHRAEEGRRVLPRRKVAPHSLPPSSCQDLSSVAGLDLVVKS